MKRIHSSEFWIWGVTLLAVAGLGLVLAGDITGLRALTITGIILCLPTAIGFVLALLIGLPMMLWIRMKESRASEDLTPRVTENSED